MIRLNIERQNKLEPMNNLFMLNTPKVRMKFPECYKIRIPHREEKEFDIKGHKIIAYSRKDAIKRLKHKKLI